ncbi:MAG: macB 9 [Verrucomicrobia bacterium]|nr:macB 9 [Verrucomicrobiota bacterium]
MEKIWHDLRFSVRALRRSTAFSLTVIATLALCIWANTAVLSVLYGLVLKPLPFRDAGQIVDVYNMRPKAGQMKQAVGLLQYLDYKAHADLFTDFALWYGWMFNIGEETGTARYVAMRVTHEYFSVLGLHPLMGRFFNADECVPGHDAVVVLTESYWKKQFHGDPDIVGKEVRLTGRLYKVVGVLPLNFEELSVAPVLMVPMSWGPDRLNPQWRLAPMGSMYARIKPGVGHGAALAQLQTLEQRNRDSVADPAQREYLYSGGHRMGLGQLRAEQTEPIKNGLLLLQGGAVFVLLLGCVNVASLMLARANTRQAEFAVRQALGASRTALARQLLTEAALLALTGGVLGLAMSATSLRVINTYMGAIIYGIPPISMDRGVLGLTLLVSLLVALLIGLLPMLRVWRLGSLQGSIQSGSRGASRGGGIRAMSGLLVVAQVALALMLLVGAGLLIRSFAKVMAINPGFDATKVIHARVAYDGSYMDPAKLLSLQNRILEKMREIPGVESVAYSDRMPGFGENNTATLPIRGMQTGHDGTYPTAIMFGASPEYLSTMGIRLLEGRNFTAADQLPGARMVFIVDRKFAERYFGGRSAVGQVFAFGPKDQKPEEAPLIVGVAEVAHVSGLENPNGEPYVYAAMGTTRGGLSVELRTSRSFAEIFPLFRAQLRAVDPNLPIYQAQTMQTRLDDAAANRRGVMWLLGAFAGIALILSAVGIYGMLAYDVTQRTKEIGIRGAIGATRGQIVAMILRQGIWKAGLGLVIGITAAFFLSRYMASLLFEVRPNDPQIFSGVAALLLLVSLLASWLPARRAAKVDPIVALRCE